MAGKAEERERSRSVAPLRALWPFLRPYRALLCGALAALVATSVLTLSLPIAVRRVVDNFFAESLALVDAYFLAALGIAALLALGTAARYYLVTTLGERVIADIRRGIYDRVVGLSPGFFERVMTGEVLSRLTTDTTLVLSVDRLVGLGGAAQPPDAHRRARAPLLDEPEAHGARPRRGAARARADPRPRAAAAGPQPREPGPHRRVERAGVGEPAARRRRCRPIPTSPRAGRPSGARRALLRRGAAADPRRGRR